jgi:hypothetical protein
MIMAVASKLIELHSYPSCICMVKCIASYLSLLLWKVQPFQKLRYYSSPKNPLPVLSLSVSAHLSWIVHSNPLLFYVVYCTSSWLQYNVVFVVRSSDDQG